MALFMASCATNEDQTGPIVDPEKLHIRPIEPKDALSTFQIKDGFDIELVASEPMVMDPMALEFDEKGRLYVVEMRYYPFIDTTSEKIGRIKLLQDTDGDGVFDKSTVFADNLRFPTALINYKGGIFVANTPDLLYLKDTDGDGVADINKKVLSGFGSKGRPAFFVQQMPNSFRWGLDNRIHGVTSGNGGYMELSEGNQKVMAELSGHDFSFDPNSFQMTKESGGMQHGMSFDDWGRKYITRQSSHIENVMYDNNYAERNPSFIMPRSHVSIASDGGSAEVYRTSGYEPWRELRTKWTVEGLLVRDENMNLQWQKPGGDRPVWQGGVGYDGGSYITSSSGITIYKGNAWPSKYRGSSFIGEPSGNLVHHDSIFNKPTGVGMVAARPNDEQDAEFLTSSDNWFRPVQFANAPDGNLFIADMYREIIDLPSGVPDAIQQYVNLQSGNDRGRIYRIVKKGSTQHSTVDLSTMSIKELVSTLDHDNGWHQSTASRLIFERQDEMAIPLLKKLLRDSKKPVTRMRVLYALSGLNALAMSEILEGLNDDHPQVRRHTIKLAETVGVEKASIKNKLLSMSNDPDIEVRYQLAFTLGEMNTKEKIHTLKKILLQNSDDEWIQSAILSSLNTHATDFFNSIILDEKINSAEGIDDFLSKLTLLIGTQDDAVAINQAIKGINGIPNISRKFEMLSALGEGLERSNSKILFNEKPVYKQAFMEAKRIIESEANQKEEKLKAIYFLGLGVEAETVPVLIKLLEPDVLSEYSLAAIKTLGNFKNLDVAEKVTDLWSVMTPAIRIQVVDFLLARPQRTKLLLEGIESKMISPKLLSASQIKYLHDHTDEEINQSANLLIPKVNEERQSIINEYGVVLNLKGDLLRGSEIFKTKCATCHKIDTIGNTIGPNLATLGSRKAKLLVDILDPNRDVAPDHLLHTVKTKDGDAYVGIISSESSNSFTIRQSNGSEKELMRSNIIDVAISEYSLMPEGLEVDMSHQDMADLLEFIVDSRK